MGAGAGGGGSSQSITITLKAVDTNAPLVGTFKITDLDGYGEEYTITTNSAGTATQVVNRYGGTGYKVINTAVANSAYDPDPQVRSGVLNSWYLGDNQQVDFTAPIAVPKITEIEVNGTVYKLVASS